MNIIKEINIINHLFDKNIENYKKNKNNTFIIYHIACSGNMNETSLEIFKSLVYKFSHNVEMIFYNMGNLFENRKNYRYSEAAYFRLVTPVFINSDRLIYLDGDSLNYLGIKSKIYINSGTILLNLKKLRDDNKIIEFINLTNSNKTLKNVDQTVINYVLHPKIGRLSSKYAMFNYKAESDLLYYISRLRTKINFKEMEEAVKNPTIIHYVTCWPKVWNANTVRSSWLSTCAQRANCSCKKDNELWHSLAKQTDYYGEIAIFTGKKKLMEI